MSAPTRTPPSLPSPSPKRVKLPPQEKPQETLSNDLLRLKAALKEITVLKEKVQQLERDLRDPHKWVWHTEDHIDVYVCAPHSSGGFGTFSGYAVCEICYQNDVYAWDHLMLCIHGCTECGNIVCENCTCTCTSGRDDTEPEE